MAATKYQVLYRYTNPNSNQFITNNSVSEYNNTFELYHDEHKIEVGTEEEKLEANNEKSDLIINGNNTANDNYNMLFKFTGTKRINKKIWKPKTTGYVIRDKDAIRNKVTRAVDGDYSGEYLLMEGDTIDNGIVVAKKNIGNIIVASDTILASNKIFYTSDELKNLITNATIYKLKSTELDNYKKGSNFIYLQRHVIYYSTTYSNKVFIGPIFIDEQPNHRSGNNGSGLCVLNEGNSCVTIEINPNDVETYEIPAHYEEVAEAPYAICDTYERVEQSPWFILSTHASLNSALEKARSAIKSVGLENVKVIKIVPTEQFVKIS